MQLGSFTSPLSSSAISTQVHLLSRARFLALFVQKLVDAVDGWTLSLLLSSYVSLVLKCIYGPIKKLDSLDIIVSVLLYLVLWPRQTRRRALGRLSPSCVYWSIRLTLYASLNRDMLFPYNLSFVYLCIKASFLVVVDWQYPNAILRSTN